YGGPAPQVAPSDRQSSLGTKSVLGEISIAPSAPQRPAFVQPSLCGGFAPHKLLVRLTRLAKNRRQIFALRFQRGSDSALTQQAFQPRPRNTSHGPDPVEFTRNAARRPPCLLRRWGRRSGGYSGLRSVRQIERSLKSVAENSARSSP